MHTIERLTMAAGLLFGGLACAGSEIPSKQIADARASIYAAYEVGADARPKAARELRIANDRWAEARELVAEGENEDAAKRLEEARLSAELAVLLTRKEDAQARALKAQPASKGKRPQDAAKD